MKVFGVSLKGGLCTYRLKEEQRPAHTPYNPPRILIRVILATAHGARPRAWVEVKRGHEGTQDPSLYRCVRRGIGIRRNPKLTILVIQER